MPRTPRTLLAYVYSCKFLLVTLVQITFRRRSKFFLPCEAPEIYKVCFWKNQPALL